MVGLNFVVGAVRLKCIYKLVCTYSEKPNVGIYLNSILLECRFQVKYLVELRTNLYNR